MIRKVILWPFYFITKKVHSKGHLKHSLAIMAIRVAPIAVSCSEKLLNDCAKGKERYKQNVFTLSGLWM
ncbi:hypothetical protein [Legionella quinlivanii]|uniref:hypothetical protein n=1 Tax=Legionella quinlivanii TaxID=45073 RepID=UPI000CDEF907|nr:hypothetical protein [Legionella quinlivanii]